MRHTKILMAAMAAGLGGAVTLMAPSDVERDLYAYARERKFPAAETLARKAAEIAGGNFPYPSLADAPESMRVFFIAFRAVIEALEPFHEDDDPNDFYNLQQDTAVAQAEPSAVADERLYDASAPMADGEMRMTAAENVLGWLLIEKIGVVDDQHYTPKEAQDTIAKAIDDLRAYELHVDQLRAVHDTAVSPGNSDANEYMRGMANGLILAVATMDDKEPAYIDPPAKQEDELSDDDKKTDDQVDEVEKKRRIAQADTDKVIAGSGGKFSEEAPKKKNKN